MELDDGNRSLLGRLLVGRGFLSKDNFLRFRYKTEAQSDSLCEHWEIPSIVVVQIHVSAQSLSSMTVENVQLWINIFPAMTQLAGAGGVGGTLISTRVDKALPMRVQSSRTRELESCVE